MSAEENAISRINITQLIPGKLTWITLGALLLLVMISLGAITQGAVKVVFDGNPLSEFEQTIVFELRLPRLLLAILVGGLLALCGAVMQGLFRNPLADPGVAGVSSGAALGAVLSLLFFSSVFWLTPIAAFIGGLLATILVWSLARTPQGTSVIMLLLSGIAISALSGAAIGYISYVADNDTLRDISLWQMGAVSGATQNGLILSAITLIGLSLYFQRHATALNALALGESEARHLGIHVEQLKLKLILCCSVGVGVAVAHSGLIGFVGLVVPHCVRLLVGPNHRHLLPLSVLFGAVLLSLADLFARLWVAPAELPIGIVTALFGAPFFFFLILKQRSRFQF